MNEFKIDQIGKAQIVVNNSNTALTIGSGSLNVFATPAMIALMEKAAVNCIEKQLDDTQTSVGTLINVSHIKASAIGAAITAVATLVNIDGRKLTFNVEAYDSDILIGKGTHERFVVDAQKFMSKL